MWISLKIWLWPKIGNTNTQLTVLPPQLYSKSFLQFGKDILVTKRFSWSSLFHPFWWSPGQEGSVPAALPHVGCVIKAFYSLYLKMNSCLSLILVCKAVGSFQFVLPLPSFLISCYLQKIQSGLFWVTFCFTQPEDQSQVEKSSITLQFKYVYWQTSGCISK